MDTDTTTAPSSSALTSGHNNITNSTESYSTSQYVPYFTEQLAHIAPLNLTLCFLAFLLNSFIIHHYYSTCTRVLSGLFMIIAAADLVTAVGHVFFLISALILKYYPGNSNDSSAVRVVVHIGAILYFCLGMFGSNCSIFYIVILSTLRTHVTVVRIPSIRSKLIVIAVIIHFIFWFTLLCIDLRNYAVLDLPHAGLHDLLISLADGEQFIGFSFGALFPDDGPYWDTLFEVSSAVFVTLSHLLPVIIVLICMFVQIVALLWGRTDDPEIRHVTTTIVLLSLLFCTCHCCNALVGVGFDVGIILSSRFQIVSSTTLPLVNAVFAPAILIFRSEALSRDFAAILKKVVGFVKRIRCSHGDEEERQQLLGSEPS